ncbi:peptidase C15 [Laspinema olomoucense]|uniref:pyroglutamyl-peptidase I family protein n=1 Tax=Laspinema olomoucense TaxID=3231600 RepID=UPI0021BB04DF|nr:peptidase C15 [Laspinema sp. D3a]MCT7991462.1 peptidase C15 [Laspinema sp. D3a]
MTQTILLTSFDIWMSHHQTNSSDELLEKVSQVSGIPHHLHFLRKLPVDFQEAPKEAIAKINELQPDLVVCCGMAESRQKLTVEKQARCGKEAIVTPLNLPPLIHDLKLTEISEDAGQFVCEALYYAVLTHLHPHPKKRDALFVHVPILTPTNFPPILDDFLHLLHRLTQSNPQ